jgi:hypothetical protein
VLSPLAQKKHSFAVESLTTPNPNPPKDAASDALKDNTITPPPDQAAFRIDFPRWLVSLGRQAQEIAEDLAQGYSTQEMAPRYKLSPGRISQLRRAFHDHWQRFHGEVG